MFSFCPVRGPKPGATVLARFSDPRTAQGGKQPVYFAEQFYGSGRVFYMGSGEMWRLRRVEPAYFEQFYTKLIRHVSQGRLLRQSTRGVLLVGQDHYLVGSTVEVRAQLTNARLEPLTVPGVSLQVSPQRRRAEHRHAHGRPEPRRHVPRPVPRAEGGRVPPGAAHPRKPGGTPDAVHPRGGAQAGRREPAAQRGPAAARSPPRPAATYYAGPDRGPDGLDRPIRWSAKLEGRSLTEVVPVAPDPKWEEDWLRWMMIALCAALCLEWLIRRLARLA